MRGRLKSTNNHPPSNGYVRGEDDDWMCRLRNTDKKGIKRASGVSCILGTV